MGTQEFAGGPILFLILYVVFIGIKEEGLIAVLGGMGKVLWFLIKMYFLVVPVFLVLWGLSKLGLTHEFPTLSWILAVALGGGSYVWFVERREKAKRKAALDRSGIPGDYGAPDK
jgi:hypothetical protein